MGTKWGHTSEWVKVEKSATWCKANVLKVC